MKRRIAVMAPIRVMMLGAVLAGGAGCSPSRPQDKAPDDAPAAAAWVQPPRIEAVGRQGADFVVRGVAGPGARVVLRRLGGTAAAVGADDAGRFEVRLPTPSGDAFFIPEVQQGEAAAPSPQMLLIVSGGMGPVALLAAGEPTVRLDGGGMRIAVDSDGSAMTVSGSGAPPVVTAAGDTAPVTADGGGRWRAKWGRTGPAAVTVGAAALAYPGHQTQPGVRRAGQGWMAVWPTPPQGRQSTWLPDPAS